MEPYIDAAVEQIRHFEGSIPWMYLDTVGKVTVGVGLMLPNEAAASALPFQLAAESATPGQIAADYARVSALAEGHPAAFYRTATSPVLPDDAIAERLRSIVSSLDGTLAAALPNWATMPEAAKLALLDMAYNLGSHGLLHGFPHFIAAVEANHWTVAASLCTRRGPGPARNDWTRQQFLSCVVPGSVIPAIKAEAVKLEGEMRSWPARIWHSLRNRFKATGR